MLVGHYEMLAATITALRIRPDELPSGSRGSSALAGRRVLITGAARGIGAATARRLHERGARVAVAGIEPELLAEVAADCGDAPAIECDVRDCEQVEAAVAAAVEQLGGLDVVIANAGVAAQLPIMGGDPAVFERTIEVNLLGVYYTLRAAAPTLPTPAVMRWPSPRSPPPSTRHCWAPTAHPRQASRPWAEALGRSSSTPGAEVGVAYFAELDTDMTSRGFGTRQRARIRRGPRQVAPLRVGVNAIERGVATRARRIVAPGWVEPVLHIRMLAQRIVERVTAPGLDKVLDIAREEHAPLTTSLAPRR